MSGHTLPDASPGQELPGQVIPEHQLQECGPADEVSGPCGKQWRDKLPMHVYREFLAIKAWLPSLSQSAARRELREACEEAAAQIRTLTGNALYRRVRAYLAAEKAGRPEAEKLLVNLRQVAALWEREFIALPASFVEFVRGLDESHQRVLTEAHAELVRIWKTHRNDDGDYVDSLPGYDAWPAAEPVTLLPKGWTYGNLSRALKTDPYDDAAAKQGLFAASAYRPPLITTRVGLLLGERVEFDDHEFDVKVHFPGQSRAMRPMCFGGVDGLSGFASLVTRPVFWDEAEEKKKILTEFQFRCFVIHWLTTHGYRADARGTIFFTESGMAVIREDFMRCLYEATGGHVRVMRGSVFSEAAHPGQFAPRGKGNFKFKPQIEGFWSILENALDRLPGRTGSNARLNGPAELHGREVALARILKLLPSLAPEQAQNMILPVLTFRGFADFVHKAMDRIMDDCEHDLEGWEQLGFEKLLWRSDVQALNWYDESDFARLPEADRQVLAPRLADPSLHLTRSRRLSRREVFLPRSSAELTRCTTKQYHRLFPVTDGFEVTVNRQHLIEFRDRARFGPQEFRFLAKDKLFGDFRPGDKFLAFFNPLNPRWLQLCKADGSHVALVEAWEAPSRNDVDAIKRQMGKQAAWEAPRKARLAARHYDEAQHRAHMLEHNRAVANGEPVTQADKERADERRREAEQAAEATRQAAAAGAALLQAREEFTQADVCDEPVEIIEPRSEDE